MFISLFANETRLITNQMAYVEFLSLQSLKMCLIVNVGKRCSAKYYLKLKIYDVMLYKIISHYTNHKGKYLNTCKSIFYLNHIIFVPSHTYKVQNKNLKDSR